MPLAAFLVAMVGPILTRILAALGVSLITMAGITVMVSTLKSTMLNNLANVPGDGLQLAGLFGVWTCLGLYFGGITFVVTWRATTGWMALAKS